MVKTMKRTSILLPIILLALVGCNSNNTTSNTESNEPVQTVELSSSNFSDYVAINSSASLINSDSQDVIYYSYFIGADYCKFIDCSVTYVYVHSGSGSSSSQSTVKLTISGDGQANPYFVYKQNNHTYYYISVISVSGTVEVYK